jgi:hypothetical protein
VDHRNINVREFLYYGPSTACVRRVGPFVWREAQPIAYKNVHLSFDLIEQPFFPTNMVSA